MNSIKDINLSKLVKLRDQNGKTLRELAEILDIGESTYFRKESGERKFTLQEANVLAEYYGLSIEEIFFDKQIH